MAKLPIVTSPRGIAKFPHLHAPDTKFDAEGVYHLKVVVPAGEGEDFAKKIDAAHAESVADANKKEREKNAKAPKVKESSLPYTFNDDGDYEFKFKCNSKGKDKTGKQFEIKPALFDAKKNPIPFGTRISGGSVVRAACEMVPYYKKGPVGAGVSLRLKAVQVIDLKTWGGASADQCGFDEEEGYEQEADAQGFTEETTEGSAADNNGDF